jgi:hypothetical protein
MRATLLIVFGLILFLMLAVTAWASWDRAVWQALDLFRDPWFVATFADAYCGFVTFYVWVAYKERSTTARVLWFLAIMGLGNIAMASYMLLQLFRLRRGASWEQLLLNRAPSRSTLSHYEAAQ